MARSSYAENQIPADGSSGIPYPDYHQVVKGVFKHGSELFIGTVTGAGGAGGTLEGVPFEPVLVVCLNPAGSTPAVHISAFGAAADHMTIAAASAANANPPVISGSGVDWDVALTTQMAPDAEVLTVLCWGCREAGGSE